MGSILAEVMYGGVSSWWSVVMHLQHTITPGQTVRLDGVQHCEL